MVDMVDVSGIVDPVDLTVFDDQQRSTHSILIIVPDCVALPSSSWSTLEADKLFDLSPSGCSRAAMRSSKWLMKLELIRSVGSRSRSRSDSPPCNQNLLCLVIKRASQVPLSALLTWQWSNAFDLLLAASSAPVGEELSVQFLSQSSTPEMNVRVECSLSYSSRFSRIVHCLCRSVILLSDAKRMRSGNPSVL